MQIFTRKIMAAGRTYQLRISQSDQHSHYVDHLYEIFKDFVRMVPRRVVRLSFSGSTPKGRWVLSTLGHHSLQFYGRRFYKKSVKCVPKDISRFLTARGLAVYG
uniref:Putative LAGLIDADG endonuclease n=1 Tax=Ostreobium quekettii TaxID=121088 RepID=A0A650BXB0_9CHLO|nr:putative LAGLIDADG endonuclease [Ostreobium quekettii]QGQ61988.1 putative LAGLIDADG endonuclease [Ostreobium quekettii]